MRVHVIVVAMCLLSADLAFADSDAYYCTARGYLAFETRLGTGKHELHIVRFGAAGITAAAPVALDDFQVHGMICRARQIEIQGRAGGIEHHTVTRLVQRQSTRPGSGIVASRQLFESVFLETVD